MSIIDYWNNAVRNYSDEIGFVEYTSATIEDPFCYIAETSIFSNGIETRIEITWGELERKINKISNFLLLNGAKRGDRIAIAMGNGIDYLSVFIGILKIGAVAVSINCNYSVEELSNCLSLVNANIIFFDHHSSKLIEKYKAQKKTSKLLFFFGAADNNFEQEYLSLTNDCSASIPHICVKDEENAAIFFTSESDDLPIWR